MQSAATPAHRPRKTARLTAIAVAALAFGGGSAPLLAQTGTRTGRITSGEAAGVAYVWGLLASGDAAGASKSSADLVAKYPRSAAVLTAAVEAEVARAGSIAALEVYERWLGSKKAEDPYALRRVAIALLREIAKADADAGWRAEAANALKEDGEIESPAQEIPTTGSVSRRGAAGGQDVDSLIAMLNLPGSPRRVAIASLAKSGNPRAVAPLLQVLSDPDPMFRSAAADALGSLGASEAIPRLKPLLDDPVFAVHLSAATALLALNDTSGLPWLRQMQTSEHAGVRLAAAQATRSEAGPEWITVVRELTKDGDPEIRRQAAELIAPYEPETARSTLEPLLTDPNPSERQAAGESYLKSTTDFALLRRYLREKDTGLRVRSAARVLELTR